MDKYEIRAIAARDKEVVNAFLALAGTSLLSFRYFNKRSIEALNNHVVTCILFHNEQPIGYGHLDRDEQRTWLGIAIAEDFKGKGYGSKIMTYLIDKAKANGVATISLSVDMDNEAAIALYKMMGFEIVGHLGEEIYLMEYQTTAIC